MLADRQGIDSFHTCRISSHSKSACNTLSFGWWQNWHLFSTFTCFLYRFLKVGRLSWNALHIKILIFCGILNFQSFFQRGDRSGAFEHSPEPCPLKIYNIRYALFTQKFPCFSTDQIHLSAHSVEPSLIFKILVGIFELNMLLTFLQHLIYYKSYPAGSLPSLPSMNQRWHEKAWIHYHNLAPRD